MEMKRNINTLHLLCGAELYIQKIVPHVCILCCFFKIGALEISKNS